MSEHWIKKLKGIAGLSKVGATLGSVGGSLWFGVSALLVGTPLLPAAIRAAIVFGSLGAFTAGGLGLLLEVLALLATTQSKAILRDVSVPWAAMVGGAAGFPFPLVYNSLVLGSLYPFTLVVHFLPIMAGTGLLGAALTSGMLATAQVAERREIEAWSGGQGLLGERATLGS